MDVDTFELFIAYLPESFEGWVLFAIVACALLSAVWPKPAETAHPFWRGLHALVNAIGFNIRHARNMQRPAKKSAQRPGR